MFTCMVRSLNFLKQLIIFIYYERSEILWAVTGISPDLHQEVSSLSLTARRDKSWGKDGFEPFEAVIASPPIWPPGLPHIKELFHENGLMICPYHSTSKERSFTYLCCFLSIRTILHRDYKRRARANWVKEVKNATVTEVSTCNLVLFLPAKFEGNSLLLYHATLSKPRHKSTAFNVAKPCCINRAAGNHIFTGFIGLLAGLSFLITPTLYQNFPT